MLQCLWQRTKPFVKLIKFFLTKHANSWRFVQQQTVAISCLRTQGAPTPGTRLPWQLNFVWWRTIFVGSTDLVMPTILGWLLEFWKTSNTPFYVPAPAVTEIQRRTPNPACPDCRWQTVTILLWPWRDEDVHEMWGQSWGSFAKDSSTDVAEGGTAAELDVYVLKGVVGPVVNICTASLTFSNPTFCPHSVFMCFVWIWEQTAIISLYSINWLVL